MKLDSLLPKIIESLINADVNGTIKWTKACYDEGVPPLRIIEEGLRVGIQKVGVLFEKGEIFLPELIASAKAMTEAVEIVRPGLIKGKQEIAHRGKVVLGTVKGDVHHIGKNLVALMLLVNGFEVFDVGEDVKTDTFLVKVEETKAEILGMSALLTTTMHEQEVVIEALNKSGMRNKVKVIVGGAPVTQQWAEKIGADGYAEDSIAAVRLCEKLIIRH